MTITVQKFGGTSLADVEAIRRCARRAAAEQDAGRRVVVVVSAMGATTDRLIELARAFGDEPDRRELDALLATGEQTSAALMTMALHALGRDAASLTGPRVGIRTDPVHGRARILEIDAAAIRGHLDAGCIVVLPGFQGLAPDGCVTTLGRGGSDTTAVAVAAALGVGRDGGTCEIYTDVDGVYTADPRLVPGARRLARIGYEEMLELASLGAGVLHFRAAIFAQKYGVPLHVRHSASPEPGTLIVKESPEMEQITVVGAALTPNLGRLNVRGVPNAPGVQAVLFEHIARANVMVDDIIQTESNDSAYVSFTVDLQDLADVKLAVEDAIAALGSGEMSVEVGLAKVSAVGAGMRTHTGVAATMFRALGEAGITIDNITTSEIKISCIVPKEHGERALRVVHDAFELAPGDERGVGVEVEVVPSDSIAAT